MFSSMKLKLFITFLLIGHFPIILSQVKKDNRLREQVYIEDSSKVFWTDYPNPFSPPTITEKSKGLFCCLATFYCELSDSVLVAVKNENDSIFYSQYISTKLPPYFSYCIWIAGMEIDNNELPKPYFYFDEKQNIKITLIVDGREKCYREGVVNDKRYYWLSGN